MGRDSFGEFSVGTRCNSSKVNTGWIQGSNSVWWEHDESGGTATNCPENLLVPHPWMCARPSWVGF